MIAKRSAAAWGLLFLMAAWHPAAGAQEPEDRNMVEPDVGSTGVSRYRLQLDHTENMIEFSVHIWGEVRNPGLYSVPEGTSMLDLISLAGGPTSAAKMKSVRLVRVGAREDSADNVLTINLEQFVKTGGRQASTRLIPEDTIVIDAKSSTSILKWTSFMTVIALAANVVVNAVD